MHLIKFLLAPYREAYRCTADSQGVAIAPVSQAVSCTSTRRLREGRALSTACGAAAVSAFGLGVQFEHSSQLSLFHHLPYYVTDAQSHIHVLHSSMCTDLRLQPSAMHSKTMKTLIWLLKLERMAAEVALHCRTWMFASATAV